MELPKLGETRATSVVALAALLIAIAAFIVAIVRGGNSDRAASGEPPCSAISVADQVMPSVVTIFVQDAAGNRAGSGTGEFLTKDGYILTNNHVISAGVGGAITIQLADGTLQPAQIVGRDPQTDLAVLKADGSDFTPIKFVKNNDLIVGQPVFAVGAPLGLSNTITAGIVSSLNRTVRVPSDNGTTALLVAAIQTDAAINPGNSGGTLANCDGELVGVPTAGATVPDSRGESASGSIGLGFAIPGDAARTVADELIKNGTATHAYFGFAVVPVGNSGQVLGLYLSSVAPDGAAAAAGLQASDIITYFDGTPVRSADQAQAIMLSRKPGDTVEVTFLRENQAHKTVVTLGAQPSL